jgi:hypothetical protein
MANFTVRVELHQASAGDYIRLHEVMEAAGYRRFLVGDDGNAYAMPTAEYDCSFGATAVSVRDHALALANSVRPGAWVLASECGNRAWSTRRLPPAPPLNPLGNLFGVPYAGGNALAGLR